MTAIVGLAHRGVVYLGGDSAAIGETAVDVRRDRKVWKRGGMVFGYAGSIRAGQVLQSRLFNPERIVDLYPDPRRFMVESLVPIMREFFRDERVPVGERVDLLVGFRGRLFEVTGADYAVGEPRCGYAAIGTGGPVALGALFAGVHTPPAARLRQALKASAQHDAGVRAPFYLVSTEAKR